PSFVTCVPRCARRSHGQGFRHVTGEQDMNRIFSKVWNPRLGAFVVASELARAGTRGCRTATGLRVVALSLLALASTHALAADDGDDEIEPGEEVVVPGDRSSPWEPSNLQISGGQLIITDGGRVRSNTITYISGNGEALVSGTGSEWIAAYDENTPPFIWAGAISISHGELTVEDGGLVSVEHFITGNSTSTIGATTVTGAGSSLRGQAVWIGYGGQGSLTIDDGGSVTATDGAVLIGSAVNYTDGTVHAGNGTATVSGEGTSLNANNTTLRVGNGDSEGELRILDGVLVSSIYGYVGDSDPWSGGGRGTASVSGAGSTWTSNQLTLGSGGQGALTISGGGTVRSSSSVVGGYYNSLDG